MAEQRIRFDDGAAYERMMGVWSRLAGAVFLDWLTPRQGLRWIDVGCGNGAFTELLVERCAPAEVQGIDPSEGQLAFARARPAARVAAFGQGDAVALPFAENTFDAAVMALVIFFLPEPGRGVAEMIRVVRPGGTVAAYAWDIPGGGLPLEPIQAELRAAGITPLLPPSAAVSSIEPLRDLWTQSGLRDVAVREIVVERTFEHFDDFWSTTASVSHIAEKLASMDPVEAERIKARVRVRLPADARGRITYRGRANAVTGSVPG